MALDMIDESANTNGGEGWHCPDCQSWGPFTVDVTRRVLHRDEGTHVLEGDGDTDYDDSAFAMCPDCQRQAPVASFRCGPVMMDDPERRLSELWTQHGVDHAKQDRILADLTGEGSTRRA